MHRSARRFAWTSLLAAAACVTNGGGGSAAPLPGAPHVVLTPTHWRSRFGSCTADVERARVVFVPQSVARRIDARLDALIATTQLAQRDPRERQAECDARYRFMLRLQSPSTSRFRSHERPWHLVSRVDWTLGIASRRWLAIRFHVERYESYAAHPTDRSYAATFDLTRDGAELTTDDMIPRSERIRLARAVYEAYVARLRRNDGMSSQDAARIATFLDPRWRTYAASEMLPTEDGLTFVGLEGNEAGRDVVFHVARRDLAGIDISGGPRDPTTRTP